MAWARHVVKNWQEKHGRGAKFLELICGIDFEILAKLVADGRTEWQQCKNLAEKHEEGLSERFWIGDIGYLAATDQQRLAALILICENSLTRSLKNALTAKMNAL